MKHRIAGRKLSRTSAHRLALLRNLSTALFDKEKITTTLGKARELRPFAEKLVTISKRETLHARRRVLRHIRDRKVVAKLFDTISARYAQRPGGYTRIIKLGPRRGDGAEMAVIELVGAESVSAASETPDEKAASKRRRPATKGAEPTEAEPAKAGKTKAKKKKKTTTRKAAAKSKKTEDVPRGAARKKKKKTTRKTKTRAKSE